MISMKIKLGSWVSLPRLSSQGFRSLMSAGVMYKTGSGFLIGRNLDLVNIKRILESELKDGVYYVFSCAVCGRDSDCSTCEYKFSCSVEKVGGKCICGPCADEISVERLWSIAGDIV